MLGDIYRNVHVKEPEEAKLMWPGPNNVYTCIIFNIWTKLKSALLSNFTAAGWCKGAHIIKRRTQTRVLHSTHRSRHRQIA